MSASMPASAASPLLRHTQPLMAVLHQRLHPQLHRPLHLLLLRALTPRMQAIVKLCWTSDSAVILDTTAWQLADAATILLHVAHHMQLALPNSAQKFLQPSQFRSELCDQRFLVPDLDQFVIGLSFPF